MANKEYKLAIKIYGEMEKSLPAAARLTKGELRAISKEAAAASAGMKGGFGKNLQDGLKSTEKIFGRIEKVGVAAFKKVTKAGAVAATAVGAASLKVGSSFESQMSTVKAISGAKGAQFDAVRGEAKDLGANTAFTATEVAQAMEYEGMAGWKSKEMIAGTKGIVDLAAASGEELSSVSDIVTDSLTAFNMAAKDSTHFSDVLAATSTNSNTNVGKMGESFKYAAPVAGTLGYNVEDTGIALGLMANSGIKESMAGTSVRSWITRMTKPTKESDAAMQALGISLTDSQGKAKSFLEVIKDTREGFAKIDSKVERSKYAKMLAGATGQSGLLAIANASEKDFKKLTKAIYDCDGAAEEMANIKLDNLEGDTKLFRSALEGAGIDIYDEIKEPLRDVVQSATEWVGDFSEWFTNGGFATISREVSEAADAFGEFAEPFLQVGSWLLENPDVLVGTIVGIGGALATYKVASGITTLSTAVAGLGPAGAAVLGVAAASGAIIGIGAAIATANKQAKDASLNNHFGKVSLSMKELNKVADEIVGARKLGQVAKLFDSLEISDGLVKSMDEARASIAKADWKMSVGIKMKKNDLSSYESDVKAYVSSAQKLVDEKGYQVNISTKVLFGESADGVKLLKDNNKFYQNLDTQAEQLSNKINSKLKKAMKDGLNVNLQSEIDGLLDQLSKITNAVSSAENEANWEMLESKWSGKDLTADSFKSLSKEIQDNVNEVEKGADASYKEVLQNLIAQKNLGYLTDKEFSDKKKSAENAWGKTKDDAKLRGQKFMYNTMMDTYGSELASGKFAKGDEAALKEMADSIEKISEFSKYGNAARGISMVMSAGGYNAYGPVSKALLDSQKRSYVYKSHEKQVKDVKENAEQYLKVANVEYKGVVDSAKKTGKNAANGLKKEVQSGLKSGIEVNTPIKMYGSYSLTGSVSNEKGNGKEPKPIDKFKKHASGGIFSNPHLGLVAEAGFPESIIPIRKSERSISLWERTGMMLGQNVDKQNSFRELANKIGQYFNAGTVSLQAQTSAQPMQVQYSPTIIVQGNADKAKIQSAMQDEYAKFKSFMKKYEKTQKRVSLK